ncbi:unnamed protein product [Durusdinium trenchii]|uniref:Globin family profile domain-containing protein n=1 Tax=Durusdinium trenchii TaxID=1381693 RepID=A0ABP0JQ19_9DINO
MSKEQATEVQDAWKAFLESAGSEDAAAEGLFNAFYEAAPALQPLFKTSRAVLSGMFFRGIQQIVMSLRNGKQARAFVEVLGFRHLEIEVTSPRVSAFRESILDLFQAELGDRFSTLAFEGFRKMLNYVGGGSVLGLVFIREHFKDRLRILSTSWAVANSTAGQEPEEEEEMATMKSNSQEPSQSQSQTQRSSLEHDGQAAKQPANNTKLNIGAQNVPATFSDMFCFNAAVMGLDDRLWMYEVLKSFDAVVRNEECNVISLRMAKIPGVIHLNDFKAIMMASLRSLVPKGWDQHHEEAWIWLWSNVEQILQQEVGKLAPRGRLVSRYVGSMEQDSEEKLSKMIYQKFFGVAPEGQDFFKQSASRLNFIVHQIFQITVQIYQDPPRMVDELSALGLRHVGYGIPTVFFGPFVSCVIESVKEITNNDQALCDAFAWSLGLVSQILMRTIDEGSTLVMKAINMNSARHIIRALSDTPRKRRAMAMLKVTVGTQSISPLLWAIQSGSMEAAQAIVQDLLTIRADRDRYYFGADDLFTRHPDIIQVITTEARPLIRVLLDRLLWRSRLVVAGHRRVNIYLQHLLVTADGQFADALCWVSKMKDPTIVTHTVLERLTDLVWNKVIYLPFLLSKVWLLFSLMVFLFSQSILKNFLQAESIDHQVVRITTFVCRAFVYMASMTELIYSQSKVAIKAIRTRDLTRLFQIPLPSKYVTDWREAVSITLTLILICMFMVEPILFCLEHFEGDFEGAGRFTAQCPQAADVQDFYSILSMFGMFCYFALLVDFSALFIPLSAFVLTAGRLLPDLLLSLSAAIFCVIVFGTAVTVSQGNPADFRDVFSAMMTLFQISVGMYPQQNFIQLEHSRWLLVMCVGFVVLVVIFLFNLLIAQLIGSHATVYRTVVGLARLNRMAVICDSMPSVRQKVFRNFIQSLRLDHRMEFGEGDIGLPGGIQVLEPAGLHPTYEDSIHRYGGSTSPNMPWPEEDEEVSNSIEDRIDNITRIFKKALKRMHLQEGKRSRSSRSSTSDSSINDSSQSSITSS